MKRLIGVSVLSTACFSDSPPVSDGGDTDETEGSSDTAGPGDDGTGSSAPGDDDGSGSADADATSVASDSTGEPPATCGDGEVQGTEACDDANDDPLDGCTSTCDLGPRELVMMMVAPPGPPIGPEGPLPISESCFDMGDGLPFVLDEYYGRRGGTDSENAWTSSVSGRCRGLGLVANGDDVSIVQTADEEQLAEHGDLKGLIDDWSLQCEGGRLPVGVSGRVYNATNIVALRLECATLEIDPSAPGGIAFQSPMPTAWTPSTSQGPEPMLMCPPGAIVVGFRGDVNTGDAAIYRFGPECAVPQVLFGPQ